MLTIEKRGGARVLAGVRHVVLDMDGTICEGARLYECTKSFFKTLAQLQISHSFLTNNSSRSREAHIRHLASMGLRIARNELYTSTQHAAEYLRRKLPAVRRLFILGTTSMRRELSRMGFEDVDEAPDAVLVGFDKELVYKRLCKAGYWIARGCPFLATHPDRVCPSDLPTLLIDCGAITACLEKATGRQSMVLGKPDASMLLSAIAVAGVGAGQTLMVGDRLDTDVAMAVAAGVRSAHINAAMDRSLYAREARAPDIAVRDLADLEILFRKTQDGDGFAERGAQRGLCSR